MAESPPHSVQDFRSQNPNPNLESESESPTRVHHPQTPEEQQLEEEQNDVEEGMSFTLSPHPQSSISDTLESKGGTHTSVSSARRGPKRKKGQARMGQRAQIALQKRLETLKLNFNPIPFVPGKVLDFSRYELFLKKLGLWDFAQIEFDRNLRDDLVAEVIVNYAPKQRYFYVNGCRIAVNRADFGRALKLPAKKAVGVCDGEEFSAEFLVFLNEFVSNWMLLHEDSWITPSEVVNWLNMIKNGHPEKVDWAGLVWFMVEKELAQGPNLKDCYYASHLQHLIKMQKEELFRASEDVKVDLTVEDDDDCGDDIKMLDMEEFSSEGQKFAEGSVAPMGTDRDGEKVEDVGNVDNLDKVEDVDGVENAGDAQIIGSVNEICNEEKCVENSVSDDKHVLSVDVGNELVENVNMPDEHVENLDVTDEHVENVDTADERVEAFDNNENVEDESNMMDYSFCKEQEQEHEQGSWLLDGKNGSHHFLQRCNVDDSKLSIESEGIKQQEIEEDGDVEGFRIIPKGHLDGISEANLMHAFESEQLQYPSSDLGGHTSLELMSSRVEDHNVMLGGPSSIFNHIGKREIDHDHDDDDDITHHALTENHKKMRLDGSWGHKSSDFDMVMDQILHMVDKAKMVHEAEKEEAYEQVSVNQQFVAHEMARKDNEIMMLRCKVDELERRRQAEVNRLDRELYLMNSVISGYRKALKGTQRQFAEHRKRHGIRDEPIYKDTGSGGVVKSVMELEKERVKQEQERKILRYYLEEAYKKQLNDYELKWSEIVDKVQFLDDRLVKAAGDVEVLTMKRNNACVSAENETEDK